MHTQQTTDKPTPSYYAIIPATVRYDRDLEPAAKLLYGELTALANMHGYCWASNAYFAELYGVDERTIKRWLKSLFEKQYIAVEIDRSGFSTKRKIFISDNFQKSSTAGHFCPPGVTKMSPGGDKNVPHNNTSNTTSKNTTTPPRKIDLVQTATAEPVVVYPKKEDQQPPADEMSPKSRVLADLNLSEGQRSKLMAENTIEELTTAAKRCAIWKGRPDDMTGMVTCLRQADDWVDNSPSDLIDKNTAYLRSLDPLNGTTLGPIMIRVGTTYAEFSGGQTTRVYKIDEKDFIDQCKKMFEKLEVYKK